MIPPRFSLKCKNELLKMPFLLAYIKAVKIKTLHVRELAIVLQYLGQYVCLNESMELLSSPKIFTHF